MPKIVVIGGSAGSINVLKTIFKALPPGLPAAVLVVSHIGARDSILPDLLQHFTDMPVRHALQGDTIVDGQVLVAPPDVHLTVAVDGDRRYAHLSRGPKENHARPAIDPLFRSAAMAYGPDATAVLLSGFLDDGTVGLQAIKACGGVALVQDPADAEVPDMPASALRYVRADLVRDAQDIAPALVKLVHGEATPRVAAATAAGLRDWVAIENRMFNQGAEMEELDRIGSRVALTCPECGGAIWEMKQDGPLRYRCHTGHAFSARVLSSLQGSTVEEALWAALRALHEQEMLFRQLHQQAQGAADIGMQQDEYLAKAKQASDHAQLLRDLIANRMSITPV